MKNAVYVNFNTMCENWTNGFDDLRGIIQILNANGIVSRSEGKQQLSTSSDSLTCDRPLEKQIWPEHFASSMFVE